MLNSADISCLVKKKLGEEIPYTEKGVERIMKEYIQFFVYSIKKRDYRSYSIGKENCIHIYVKFFDVSLHMNYFAKTLRHLKLSMKKNIFYNGRKYPAKYIKRRYNSFKSISRIGMLYCYFSRIKQSESMRNISLPNYEITVASNYLKNKLRLFNKKKKCSLQK